MGNISQKDCAGITYLKNATVYSREHNLINADIEISSGKIRKIIPQDNLIQRETLAGSKVIDASNMIIFPGIINGHLHPSKELYKYFRDFSGISDVLGAVHKNYTYENRELQEISSLYSLLRQIRHGVTAIGVFTSRAEIDIAQIQKSGIRANVHFSQNDQWVGKEDKPSIKRIEEILKVFLEASKLYDSETISIHPATASELSSSVDLMKEFHKIAKKNNKRFALHIHEGLHQVQQCKNYYNKTGIELLYENDCLDENTLLIHACSLKKSEISLLMNKRVNIVHCPVSNSFTGSGKLPVRQLYRLPISIGTDAAMVNPFNRLAFDAAFSMYFHGESVLEEKLTSIEAVDSITVNGAKALGLSNLGYIDNGVYADLCFFEKKSTCFGIGNSSLAFIDTLLTELPKHVMINGKFVVFDGHFCNIDFSSIQEEFYKIKRVGSH